jgi:hypothetical protein
MKSKERRLFIQKAFCLCAIGYWGFFFSKPSEANEVDIELANPEKGMAEKVVYHHSHSDAEKNARTAKLQKNSFIPWDQQYCSNCRFYKILGEKQNRKVGSCTLIPGYCVADEGICNRWFPKSVE